MLSKAESLSLVVADACREIPFPHPSGHQLELILEDSHEIFRRCTRIRQSSGAHPHRVGKARVGPAQKLPLPGLEMIRWQACGKPCVVLGARPFAGLIEGEEQTVADHAADAVVLDRPIRDPAAEVELHGRINRDAARLVPPVVHREGPDFRGNIRRCGDAQLALDSIEVTTDHGVAQAMARVIMLERHLHRIPSDRPELTGFQILQIYQAVADRVRAPTVSVAVKAVTSPALIHRNQHLAVPGIVDPRPRGVESREDKFASVLGKGAKGIDGFIVIHGDASIRRNAPPLGESSRGLLAGMVSPF